MNLTNDKTRGFRNNNPGNIEYLSGIKWIGQTGNDDAGYCIFKDAVWGIRAGCRIWMDYKYHHSIITIADAIARWAPPSRNPTASYADYVAHRIGVSINQPIDFCSYALPILKAVCVFENGSNPYPDALYQRAITLAHMM